MNLLWFNLATDADDPILGFTSAWIRAVAERVARIHVVTMRQGRLDLPGNVDCVSVGKERGHSRTRRILNFYRIVSDILRTERVDGCFSHMIPLFSILAAPLLKRRGVPLVTWYAHPSLTAELKLAHYLSDAVVTSLPSTYPYKRDKLQVIGQGIDTDSFAPNGTSPQSPPMILCAGRLSPVKDHPTLLKSIALLRERLPKDCIVVFLGSPARASDEHYAAALKTIVRDLGIAKWVEFLGGVSRVDLPEWYRRATVHVNLTRAGFGDKVALESMACGRPTLVANDDFRETLGPYVETLLFRAGDAEDLGARLLRILGLADDEREDMGVHLRARVQELHSLDGLASRVVNLFEGSSERASLGPDG